MSIKDRVRCWDHHHRNNNINALSGVSYEDTINGLNLQDIIQKGDKILEVGIGLGYTIMGFNKDGFDISAFDISNYALNRVKDICNIYKKVEELPRNYFDIILCSNVVQHTPTALLKYELKYIIQSLTEKGILAINSISSHKWQDSGVAPFLFSFDRSIGCFCRQPRKFSEIIFECGGVCDVISDIPIVVNESFINGSQRYHVRKRIIHV